MESNEKFCDENSKNYNKAYSSEELSLVIGNIRKKSEDITIGDLTTYDDYHRLTIDCISRAQTDYYWLILGGNVECLYIHTHGAQTLKEMVEKSTELSPSISFEDSYIKIINDPNFKGMEEIINYKLDYNIDYRSFSLLKDCLIKNEKGNCIESPQQLFMRISITLCWPDVKAIKSLYHDLSLSRCTLNLEVMKHAGICSEFLEESCSGELKEEEASTGPTDKAGRTRFKGSRIASFSDIFIEKFIEGNNFKYPDNRKNEEFDHIYGLEYRKLYEEKIACSEESIGRASRSSTIKDSDGFDKAGLSPSSSEISTEEIIKELIKIKGPNPILYRDTIYKKSNAIPTTFFVTDKTFNLGVINLDSCVNGYNDNYDHEEASIEDDLNEKKKWFSFKMLSHLTSGIVKTLNRILDYYNRERKNYFPGNNREIFITVQGLADTFVKLDMEFDSPASKALNILIFETIYYSFIKTSSKLAKKFGSHQDFNTTLISKGILYFDLWARERADKAALEEEDPLSWKKPIYTTDRYDWSSIGTEIVKNGMRNSGGVCIIPLDKLSVIAGRSPGVEPLNNFFYLDLPDKTIGILHRYLSVEFKKYNMWNDPQSIIKAVILSDGSLSRFENSTDKEPNFIKSIGLSRIKSLFKSAPLILRKCIIDMAISRGPFITEFHYFNTYIKDVTFMKIKSIIEYCWNKGLKSSLYQIIEFNPKLSTYIIR